MTTFTTEDRIIAEKDGSFTINVEGGTVKMNEPVAWIDPKELDMTVSTNVTKTKQFDGDIPLYTHPAELTDEEISVVAILQDAEIVPVGHEIWKTGEEFNKYKRIVLATAKALRKAQEK